MIINAAVNITEPSNSPSSRNHPGIRQHKNIESIFDIPFAYRLLNLEFRFFNINYEFVSYVSVTHNDFYKIFTLYLPQIFHTTSVHYTKP